VINFVRQMDQPRFARTDPLGGGNRFIDDEMRGVPR
jgi:hypothetical protein